MSDARYDHDAERALLGAVMLDSRVFLDLDVEAQDFHRPAHEELWNVLANEARRGRPTDPIAISQLIRGINGLEVTYLHECLSLAPVPAKAGHYAGIVKGLALLRRAAITAKALFDEVQNASWENASDAIDKARALLDETASKATGIRVRTFADALESTVEEWDAPAVKAHPTGWSDLDGRLNGGWRPGQITTLGARPAVGKSLIATCAAVAAQRYGAGIFSLEMSEAEVVSRMTASAKGIELARLNSGNLTDDDWAKVSDLAQAARGWPVYIEDRSRITMAQIEATVRTWMRKQHLPLIIIDYAQLVTPADRNDSRERQVSRIVEDCKHLAKSLNTHVLVLAQVNRESDKRTDKRPTMGDLRESGGIEAHSDNIILLHRDPDRVGEIELILAKNRHGPTDTINLAWRPQYASANSMAHHDNDHRFGMSTPH